MAASNDAVSALTSRDRKGAVAAAFPILALCLIVTSAMQAKDRIAGIEFFGYQGIDTEAVRKALPFHEGDALKRGMPFQARETVKRITGRDATDVQFVCCVNDGDTAIFIGLPGTSSRPAAFNPEPRQEASVSSELAALMQKMYDGETKASSGMEVSPPSGYRLMKDPAAQAAELKVRDYARLHETDLIHVLSHSSDAEQRALAADALGFSGRSAEQIIALAFAVRDANDTVRNNAARALAEILEADPAVAAQISPSPFIELIQSGKWTDRNKASMVLGPLTRSRNPELLARLKAGAWDALMEMARWPLTAWSGWPRTILARIAGIPEEQATEISFGKTEAFLDAIGRK